MRLCISLVLFLLAAASSQAAEAVAYRGTIGRLPTILELVQPGHDGTFVGRYSYLSKGGDIPLHGRRGPDGNYTLREEAPCTEELCRTAKGDLADKAPIGAEWTLTSGSGGQPLTGEWKDVKTGKRLALRFERVASRALPEGSETLDGLDPIAVVWRDDSDSTMSPAQLPYDFLKMDVPLKQGAETMVGDGIYRLDEDSRTAIAYPTVVSLDGAKIGPINTYLRQQRLQFSLSSFYCLSKAYLGLGWTGWGGEGATGYEDGGSVTVNLLSSRLLGITESGSYYCGGAHPSHVMEYRLADVKTGKPIVPERLLKGWISRNAEGEIVEPAEAARTDGIGYGPSDELVDYVNARRDKSDESYEKDCAMSELVRTNLGVYFTQDELIFTLKGLPHVSFACTDDLVKVPLKDAGSLLTETGAKYFSVLDR